MPSRRIIAILAVAGGLAALAPAPARAQPSAEDLVNAFEAVLGPIRSHRPSHAKRTCAAGHFVATSEGTRLSAAPTFSGERVAALIRFGVGVGNPGGSDTSRTTRGLAIRFETAAGDVWEQANISVPVFGVPTPELFVQNLLVRRPDPATGQPTPIASLLSSRPIRR